MRKTHWGQRASACVLGTLLPLSNVAAQQAEASADYSSIEVQPERSEAAMLREREAVPLETIVVIGEKVGRTLEQTTSSAAVVSGEQLQDYGDDSVADVLQRTANASVGIDGDISLRGVNGLGAEGYETGQPVISTYVDGIAVDGVGQQGNVLDLFDIDQVEVLRGAQSTSQGRNALAGAVVVNTREPTEEWTLSTRMRLAELNERQYAMAGGGALGAGFAFRLVADHQSDDGFITNVTRDESDWNRQQDTLLRGRLAWRPAFAPDFDALLTVGGAWRKGGGASFNSETPSNDETHRKAYDDLPNQQKSRSLPASLRLRHAFTPQLELTSTTGLIRSTNDLDRDYDGTAAANGANIYDQRGRSTTQELRLNVRDWHGLTGLVGVYAGRFRDGYEYYSSDFPTALSEVLPVPVVGDLLAARVDQTILQDDEADNVAVFTEFDYAVTERLTLITGLRYDREKSETFSNYEITRADLFVVTPEQAALLDPLLSQAPLIPALPALQAVGIIPGTGGGQTAGATYDALLPKLGLRYAFTPDVTGFLTYTEAYRAGGADVNTQDGSIRAYQPEYTQTGETGFRIRVPSLRLQSRLNVYYTRWRDQQVLILDPESQGFYTDNAANSKLYGAEWENALRVGARSSVYLNGGYAHTRFEHYVNSTGDYSGKRFVTAPQWTAGAGFVARPGWLAGWFASSSFSFTDTAYSTPENQNDERADARRVLDARIGYETDHLSIVAFGRNLLDDDYALYRYSRPDRLAYPAGHGVGYGPPRVLGIQVTLDL